MQANSTEIKSVQQRSAGNRKDAWFIKTHLRVGARDRSVETIFLFRLKKQRTMNPFLFYTKRARFGKLQKTRGPRRTRRELRELETIGTRRFRVRLPRTEKLRLGFGWTSVGGFSVFWATPRFSLLRKWIGTVRINSTPNLFPILLGHLRYVEYYWLLLYTATDPPIRWGSMDLLKWTSACLMESRMNYHLQSLYRSWINYWKFNR